MKSLRKYLSSLFVGFCVSYGFTKLADSHSSLIRTIYIYSHPIVVFCLAILALCFTEIGLKIANVVQIEPFILFADATIFKIISAFAERSTFPNQTKFFLGFWILVAPIMTFILIPRIAHAERKSWYMRWELKTLQWQVLMVIALSLVLIAGVVGALLPGDPAFCKGCTTHSRMGLFIIYGFGMPSAIALLLAAISNLVVYASKNFVNTYLSGK